ncbi:hypothetical protein SeF6b_056 [Salmonella phage SeF6b]|nr:hypothetical protein SeF6b_056 [Salmonella phage SeF6b]
MRRSACFGPVGVGFSYRIQGFRGRRCVLFSGVPGRRPWGVAVQCGPAWRSVALLCVVNQII